jgi:dTDP-4-amino-4,6-dideoxygalactose transaminase
LSSTWKVPLSDIAVDAELSNAVRETLESGWWSMGPRVADLEARFAEFADVTHAFAVANGTAALHLALLAVGCGPGDEVVLPSLNFVAAANTVAWTGATPVFCDIVGQDDLNLDPDDLERAIGESTRAVIVLHYGGYACDLERVLALADRRGISVIEDAAHAIGARWSEGMLGSAGAVGCFSFFSNKNLPVGEGGMIVTSDEEIADRVRLLRSHGMTTLTWQRHTGHASTYDVLTPGFNYRLDELRSALAIVQLERLHSANAARARHVRRYRSLLDGVNGLAFPFSEAAVADSSHHLAVVILPEGAERDGIRQFLQREGIQTSVHYPPIHTFTAYSETGSRRALPRTDEIAGRILTLPLFPHMQNSQVELVAEKLVDALTAASG